MKKNSLDSQSNGQNNNITDMDTLMHMLSMLNGKGIKMSNNNFDTINGDKDKVATAENTDNTQASDTANVQETALYGTNQSDDSATTPQYQLTKSALYYSKLMAEHDAKVKELTNKK